MASMRDKTNIGLQREVDLRPEEVLDAYWIVMQNSCPGLDLSEEFPVYNLLAKMSQMVAYSTDMTWTKALE